MVCQFRAAGYAEQYNNRTGLDGALHTSCDIRSQAMHSERAQNAFRADGIAIFGANTLLSVFFQSPF